MRVDNTTLGLKGSRDINIFIYIRTYFLKPSDKRVKILDTMVLSKARLYVLCSMKSVTYAMPKTDYICTLGNKKAAIYLMQYSIKAQGFVCEQASTLRKTES